MAASAAGQAIISAWVNERFPVVPIQKKSRKIAGKSVRVDLSVFMASVQKYRFPK